jgi:RNA polymerase sigma-70 factor, ECF subfamily
VGLHVRKNIVTYAARICDWPGRTEISVQWTNSAFCPECVNSASTTTELNETALLVSIARGDRHAFSQFYDRVSGLLFSMAVRILRDPAAAEDVTQDVFVEIWEKASTYNPALGKPLTWVITLTRNRAIDRLRAAQRRHNLAAAAAGEQASDSNTAPARPSIGTETSFLIRSAVTQLPAEQRRAIELAFFGGMTQAEIATALQKPLGTVKAHIRRGMLTLRDSLEGHL